MKRTYYSDIRRPLAPGAGLVLGAAGRKDRFAPCPGLCPPSSPPPFAGSCPCGSPLRPL